MTYIKLTVDEISQLEAQAGKKTSEIIDSLLEKITELTERIDKLEKKEG